MSGEQPSARKSPLATGDFAYADQLNLVDLVGRDGIPLGWHTDVQASGKGITYGPRLMYQGDRHLVTIAPSRTGKGTTAIIPTLLEYEASMLVIDPKGQNAAITAERRREIGHAVFCLNPFGLHGEEPWQLPRHRFNPLDRFDPASETFVADMMSLCEALIITEGKDPHWSNSARDLVAGILMFLKTTPEERATLGRMREIITLPPPMLTDQLLKMSKSDYPPVAQKASRFLSGSNEIQSIVSTAISQTSFLDDPAIAASLEASDFDFADLKTKRMTVYLILPARFLSAHARWLRLMVVSTLDTLTMTPAGDGFPVLLLLDEFAQLGHLSAVENAMGMAAGYGIQLWCILQDLNQAKNIYGDRHETFLANAGIVQIFTPNDLTTADYFSKRSGLRSVRSSNINEQEISRGQAQHGFTGTSTSYAETTVPMLSPQLLIGMAPHIQVIFAAGLDKTITGARHPYFKLASYNGLYDPDPYYRAPSRPLELPKAAPLPPPEPEKKGWFGGTKKPASPPPKGLPPLQPVGGVVPSPPAQVYPAPAFTSQPQPRSGRLAVHGGDDWVQS
jgi:type IV secretion system protein VirD4